MDDARQRLDWKQTAAIVCMVYNSMCDTRKSGMLTPEKVHPLACEKNVESAGPKGTSFNKETAQMFKKAWRGPVVTYKPEG